MLQGDDELSIARVIGELKIRHIPDGFIDMNFVRLDGHTVSKSDLATHINMLPLG